MILTARDRICAAVMIVHLHVGGRLQGNYDEMTLAERVLSVGKTIALFLKTRHTFRGVSGGFE